MAVKKRKPASEKSKQRERALLARQADEANYENIRVRRRNSQLNTWKVTELEKGNIGIECPRCRGKAKVKKRDWLFIAQDFLGRACTHCFYSSWIPLEVLPAKDDRRYDYERLERKNARSKKTRRRRS